MISKHISYLSNGLQVTLQGAISDRMISFGVGLLFLGGVEKKICLLFWSVQPGGTLDLEGPFGLKGIYQ